MMSSFFGWFSRSIILMAKALPDLISVASQTIPEALKLRKSHMDLMLTSIRLQPFHASCMQTHPEPIFLPTLYVFLGSPVLTVCPI